jgi:hypothetical protein
MILQLKIGKEDRPRGHDIRDVGGVNRLNKDSYLKTQVIGIRYHIPELIVMLFLQATVTTGVSL